MNPYVSDAEQVQLIKDWLKKYGLSIILGVTIALVGSFGWRYWQQHAIQTAAEASETYEQMMIARESKEMDAYLKLANKLIKDYAKTPYAGLAGLLVAQDAVNKNDLNTADKQLQWVMQHAKDKDVCQLAAIRYARVLLAENKPEDALKTAEKIDQKSGFHPAALIVKGDALVALKKPAAAREAYQTALLGLPASSMIKPYVEMKYDQLAGS